MNKSFLADYSLYISARLLSFLFRALPIRLALHLGRIMGTVASWLDVRHRAVVYANLKIAFCQKRGPQQLSGMVRRVFQNFSLVLIEALRLPQVDLEYVDRYIQIEGLEHIDEALRGGRGAIILGAHFGNWELASATCALKGYNYKVLAREQRFPKLNNLLNQSRNSIGYSSIPRGMATRQIIKALTRNELVGIAGDQGGGGQGVLVKFFNRVICLPIGAVRLARKFNSPILPSFIIRLRGPFHRIVVGSPLQFDGSGNLEQDLKVNLEGYARILEQLISGYPEQYLWFYKLWKYSPQRSVLILSDGKSGHLNQALAVMEAIKKELPDADHRVVRIEFKDKFRQALLATFGLFARQRCQGCLRCLKFCLKKESFNQLMRGYADIIISCGSSLAGINLLLSKENRAKNIVIMKPPLFSLRRFTLAIIPAHDRPKRRFNIIKTKGALNLIDENCLRQASTRLSSIFPPATTSKPKSKIGLLVGGNSREYRLSKEIVETVIQEIKSSSLNMDAEILVTTSRRTPRKIEALVKERLSDFPGCRLLVIANERNIEGAVPGILGLSEVVVVSPDSISMISEAASSGRYVVVFKPKTKGKHERFLNNLARGGYIFLVQPREIEAAIRKVWQKAPPVKKLEDRDLIWEAVKRVL